MKKDNKAFVQKDYSKDFVALAQELNENQGLEYKEIAQIIGWNASALSSTIKGERDIPYDAWERFKTLYNFVKSEHVFPTKSREERRERISQLNQIIHAPKGETQAKSMAAAILERHYYEQKEEDLGRTFFDGKAGQLQASTEKKPLTDKRLNEIVQMLSRVTSSLEYNISRTLMNEALLRTGLYYHAQLNSRDEKHYKATIEAINQSAVAIFDDIFRKSGLLDQEQQKVSGGVQT